MDERTTLISDTSRDRAFGGDRDATVAIPTLDPDPRMLASVLRAATTAVDLPIVVVDMSRNDRTRMVCLDFAPQVSYHAFPDSVGISDSRNRCVELALTNRVIFLDSDAFVSRDWAIPLLDVLDRSDVGVVGARIVPRWSSRPPWLFRSHLAGLAFSLLDLGNVELEIPRVIGTSYAIDRRRVPAPPFDVSIGRRPGSALAGEENELSIQSRNMGFKIIYAPESVVWHDIGPSRQRWPWIWSRAYALGRELEVNGRDESFPFPDGAPSWADQAFKVAVGIPFVAGVARERLRSWIVERSTRWQAARVLRRRPRVPGQ